MASNVYTKNEILQNLASKGFFIDAYTLDTFLDKWKVEAVFEDEQGSEFYDKNTLELVLSNLFNANNDEPEETIQEEIRTLTTPQNQNVQPQIQSEMQPQIQPQVQIQQPIQQPQVQVQQIPQPQIQPMQVQPQQVQTQPQMQYQEAQQPSMLQQDFGQQIEPQQTYQVPPPPVEISQPTQEMQQNDSLQFAQEAQEVPVQNNDELKFVDDEFKIDDSEAADILNSISLSDGTSLMDGINTPIDDLKLETPAPSEAPLQFETPKSEQKEPQKMGILEGALEAAGQTYEPAEPITQPDEILPPTDELAEMADFDDMSLLSESYEAQERFRDYIVSELSKKNMDVTPKSNEFKLDISERTINMVARTMGKKIAKHVTSLLGQSSQAEIAQYQEKIKKIEQKAKALEEENKKLRLVAAELNKNLNSYKPSIFGLYKKVNPKK